MNCEFVIYVPYFILCLVAQLVFHVKMCQSPKSTISFVKRMHAFEMSRIWHPDKASFYFRNIFLRDNPIKIERRVEDKRRIQRIWSGRIDRTTSLTDIDC